MISGPILRVLDLYFSVTDGPLYRTALAQVSVLTRGSLRHMFYGGAYRAAVLALPHGSLSRMKLHGYLAHKKQRPPSTLQ